MLPEALAADCGASPPAPSRGGSFCILEDDIDGLAAHDEIALKKFDLLASSFRNVPELYRLAYKSQHSKIEAAVEAQTTLRRDVDRMELNLRKTQEQHTNQAKRIKEAITELAQQMSSRRRRSTRHKDSSSGDGPATSPTAASSGAAAMAVSSTRTAPEASGKFRTSISGLGGDALPDEPSMSIPSFRRSLRGSNQNLSSSIQGLQSTTSSNARMSLNDFSGSLSTMVGMVGIPPAIAGGTSDDESDDMLTQEDRRRLETVDSLEKRVTAAHQSLHNVHSQVEKMKKSNEKVALLATHLEERVTSALSEAKIKDLVRSAALAAVPRWLVLIGATTEDSEDGVADAFREGREAAARQREDSQRHDEELEALAMRVAKLEAEVFDGSGSTNSGGMAQAIADGTIHPDLAAAGVAGMATVELPAMLSGILEGSFDGAGSSAVRPPSDAGAAGREAAREAADGRLASMQSTARASSVMSDEGSALSDADSDKPPGGSGDPDSPNGKNSLAVPVSPTRRSSVSGAMCGRASRNRTLSATSDDGWNMSASSSVQGKLGKHDKLKQAVDTLLWKTSNLDERLMSVEAVVAQHAQDNRSTKQTVASLVLEVEHGKSSMDERVDALAEIVTEIREPLQLGLANFESACDERYAHIQELAEGCVRSIQGEMARYRVQLEKIFPRAVAQGKTSSEMTVSEARLFGLDSRLDVAEEQIATLTSLRNRRFSRKGSNITSASGASMADLDAAFDDTVGSKASGRRSPSGSLAPRPSAVRFGSPPERHDSPEPLHGDEESPDGAGGGGGRRRIAKRSRSALKESGMGPTRSGRASARPGVLITGEASDGDDAEGEYRARIDIHVPRVVPDVVRRKSPSPGAGERYETVCVGAGGSRSNSPAWRAGGGDGSGDAARRPRPSSAAAPSGSPCPGDPRRRPPRPGEDAGDRGVGARAGDGDEGDLDDVGAPLEPTCVQLPTRMLREAVSGVADMDECERAALLVDRPLSWPGSTLKLTTPTPGILAPDPIGFVALGSGCGAGAAQPRRRNLAVASTAASGAEDGGDEHAAAACPTGGQRPARGRQQTIAEVLAGAARGRNGALAAATGARPGDGAPAAAVAKGTSEAQERISRPSTARAGPSGAGGRSSPALASTAASAAAAAAGRTAVAARAAASQRPRSGGGPGSPPPTALPRLSRPKDAAGGGAGAEKTAAGA